MPVVYAVINQKGGVGKSTTALSLASGLYLKGYKVLSVDLDAQCNFSFASDADLTGKTIFGVITGEVKAEQAVQMTRAGDLIPGSRLLSGADAIITNVGKEYKLREALDSLLPLYDFVVIDTPPALGILTVNALTACDSVIIPAQADVFSLMGISQLMETIEPVKKYCNPGLSVSGILLTRYNPRSILSRDITDMAEDLAQQIGSKVFESKIREAVVVKEAQISKQSIFRYAPSSKVAGDYLAFIDELLKEVQHE